MDAKALAKSKRAHSLHHSKKHRPHKTFKDPSAGAATSESSKKPAGKQERGKSQQTQSSIALPLNWDQYEEEYESASEDTPQESTRKVTDVVAPKSKGADYAYLISEAMAQSQSKYSFDNFPSFDDALDDFNQGLGPLLSAKGESILSWIADDSFAFEDKATSKHEASFLSLDLNTLAEQLAKANLYERLFIEPDRLPPELFTDSEAHDNKEPERSPTASLANVNEKDFHAVSSSRVSEENNSMYQYEESLSSDTTASSFSAQVSTSAGSKPFAHPKDKCWQFKENSQATLPRSAAEANMKSAHMKPSRFEAISAEAELDMLLDSFGDTKFLESTSTMEKSRPISYPEQTQNPASFPEETSFNFFPAEPAKISPVNKSAMMDVNLDDTIDDLLKETSNPTIINDESSSLKAKDPAQDTSSVSNTVSRSKLLDDFDSWLDTI